MLTEESRLAEYARSMALFERASRVIPGGIYGHQSPASVLPLRSPYFAHSAKGCRYTDVDGREYIDFLCGYGPVILGHGDEAVEAAAEAQRQAGDCMNHPTERVVELAEYLTGRVSFADWAVFAKNGSDLTTWAVMVARAHTGRAKVLKVKASYHGTDAWCSPGHAGVLPEDRANVHSFEWNDADGFRRLLKKYRNNVAAVILTPYHHPAFADSVMPAPGFFQEIREACDKEGVVFILDDIRAGFRLHDAGSHAHFGFEPDLIVFCKALANGHTLSAALGRKALKASASKVFLTGSYWNSAVPMAAALACLEACKERRVVEKLQARGTQLMRGIEDTGRKYGLPVKMSGPPAMPTMRFADEENFLRLQDFCALAMEEGVFLHPHHNWFLCAAHTEADILEALARIDRAFERLVGEASD